MHSHVRLSLVISLLIIMKEVDVSAAVTCLVIKGAVSESSTDTARVYSPPMVPVLAVIQGSAPNYRPREGGRR